MRTKFRDKLNTPVCVGDTIVKANGSRTPGISLYKVTGETEFSLMMRRVNGVRPLAYRDFSSMLVIKDQRVDELFEE